LSEVVRIKKKYEEYLLGIKGVTGVGVNGSIVVYVEKLTPELRKVLPKDIEGIPVRIKEVGRIKIILSRTDRWRPAPGGVSCGHPEITAGTLSCRAYDLKTKEILGLSNNHVIALDWGALHIGEEGDSVLQPGPYDGGRDPRDKIGELERWIPVKLEEYNLVDAACFRSDLLKEEVLDIGVPDAAEEPSVGTNVVKSGRTSGVTYGKIIDVNATVKVHGWGVCIFEDQVVVEPAFLRPGDSGSWVGDADTYRTVGLGHASSPFVSIVCKATNIERLLGIRIIPPTRGISPFALFAAFGGLFAAGAVVYKQPKLSPEERISLAG